MLGPIYFGWANYRLKQGDNALGSVCPFVDITLQVHKICLTRGIFGTSGSEPARVPEMPPGLFISDQWGFAAKAAYNGQEAFERVLLHILLHFFGDGGQQAGGLSTHRHVYLLYIIVL